MSNDGLVDRYKRYKAGTATLVTWLSNTARQRRDVSDILPSLRTAKNASKQAKKKNSGISLTDTTVSVPTASLVKLAEIVAETAKDIPREMISIARDVIAGRQACALWYAGLEEVNSPETESANSGHQHFIHVLQQVTSVLDNALKACAPVRKQFTQKMPTSTTEPVEGLTNVFSYLEVEQPTSAPLGATPASSRTSPPKIRFELESTREQTRFAIWCRLQDLGELRKEVRKRWLDWSVGKISFMAACTIADTATTIARHSDLAFTEEFPELSSLTDYVEYLGFRLGVVSAQPFVYAKDGTSSLPFASKSGPSSEITRLFCPHACILLQSVRVALGGSVGAGTKASEQFAASWQKNFKVHPFGPVLAKWLHDLKALRTLPTRERLPADSFVWGLLSLSRSPEVVPTWLSMGCQIHMDAYDILSQYVEPGACELEAVLAQAKATEQSIGKQVFAHASSESPTSPPAEIEMADGQTENDKPVPIVSHEAAGFMLEAFPQLRGHMSIISAQHQRSLGIRVCDERSGVLALAHLYRAAFSAGLLSTPWPDMDFVIAAQSKQRSYVWESTNGVSAMAKYFGIATGLKRIAFNNGARPRLPKTETAKKKKRCMEEHFPLRKALSTLNRDQLSGAATIQKTVDAAMESLVLLQKSDSKDGPEGNLHKQWQKVGKVTPVQLLSGFSEVYPRNELDLRFDYVKFGWTCNGLMDMMRDVCKPLLELMSTEEVGDWQAYNAEMVYAILWHAADQVDHGLDNSYGPLAVAADVLRHYITNVHSGEEFLKVGRERASGYIPENLRPNPKPPLSEEQQAREEYVNIWKRFLKHFTLNMQSNEARFHSSENDFHERNGVAQALQDAIMASDDQSRAETFAKKAMAFTGKRMARMNAEEQAEMATDIAGYTAREDCQMAAVRSPVILENFAAFAALLQEPADEEMAEALLTKVTDQSADDEVEDGESTVGIPFLVALVRFSLVGMVAQVRDYVHSAHPDDRETAASAGQVGKFQEGDVEIE